MAPAALDAKRGAETENLRFLALLCLVQTILGGIYVIENPLGSDLWSKSPIAWLTEGGFALHTMTCTSAVMGR